MTDLLGPASTNAVTTRPGRSITRGANNTWFQDCSSPDASDGTAFGADFFNDSLAQFRTALVSSGIVLDGGDDMLWRAMQSCGIRYGVDTGAAGHLTVAFSPPVTTLYAGLALLIKADSDCPGAVDVTANATATKSLTWPDASALAVGDYKAGCVLLVVYDGAKFQLLFKLNANAGPAASFVPGCVYSWLTDTAPTGTLECTGAAVSRSTYARLFGILGTNYGVGNGTTTFNIPDLRGEFARYWDHGKGTDPDAATRTNRGDGTTGDHVGTKQGGAAGPVSISDASIEIDNPVFHGHGGSSDFAGTLLATNDSSFLNDQVFEPSPGGSSKIVSITGTAAITGNSGATETRPRNVNLMPIVAY